MDDKLKVEWILKIEKLQKYYDAQYLGLKLYQNDSYFEEFTNDDQNLMLKLRETLKKAINQTNFHYFYKAIKKLGKGSFASVHKKNTLLISK